MDHISTRATHSGSWTATSRPRSWRMVVGFGSGLVGWAVYTVVCSSRQAVLTDAPAKHARLWDGARHRLNGLFHNGGHRCTVHVLYRREGSSWAYDLTAISCASDAVVSRSSESGPITNFYPIFWATWNCCSHRCGKSTTLHG